MAPAELTPEDVRFWTFFVYCLVAVFLFLLLAFYTNRMWGFLLSHFLKTFLWKRYRIRFELGSVKFALLGGKVLFKNLKYQSTNQSIFICQGYITFRYWLREVLQNDIGTKSQVHGNLSTNKENKSRRSRIVVHVNGLEYFIYNRTPAYDYIEQLLNKSRQTKSPTESTDAKISEESNETFLERFLPIDIEIGRGSVIIGNDELPSILAIDWQKGNGTYCLQKARSRCDYYKNSFNFVFKHIKLQIRTNVDFKKAQNQKTRRFDTKNSRTSFSVRKPSDDSIESDDAHPSKWKGLSRYRRNSGLPKADLIEEYAKVTSVLDCYSMSLLYYYDSEGKVPSQTIVNNFGSADPHLAFNGDLPPQWGLELLFSSTILHYGPWADRQRATIQKFFFPYAYKNFGPTEIPQPGQSRVFTQFTFRIDFENEFAWRIPTRELSKDWRFRGNEANQAASSRPYGWIDLKAKGPTSVCINVPMIVSDTGYLTTIEVKSTFLDVLTSLNYSTLIKGNTLLLKWQMATPNDWRSFHTWKIDVELQDSIIFLLRDHITLLQDTMADWGSGSALDPTHYIPYKYVFQLKLPRTAIFLCINEQNIIEQPNNMDENSFLHIRSSKLTINYEMIYSDFDMIDYCFPFALEFDNIDLCVSLPLCNTIGTFLEIVGKPLASADSICLYGNYECSTYEETGRLFYNINTEMKIEGMEVSLFGFLARYLLILKNNYVGENMNFMTLEEYRLRRIENELGKAPPLADDMDYYVIMNGIIQDVTVNFPNNIYSLGQCSQMHIKEVILDAVNNFDYGDYQMSISPIEWSYPRDDTAGQCGRRICIEGLSIHAHLLFGSKVDSPVYFFESTYLVGPISGNVDLVCVRHISHWFSCFNFTLLDLDNSLTDQSDLLEARYPCLSYFRFHCRAADIFVWLTNYAIMHCNIEPSTIFSRPLLPTSIAAETMVFLPSATFRLLQISTLLAESSGAWSELFFFSTGVKMRSKSTNNQNVDNSDKVIEFITDNDSKNAKCKMLLNASQFSEKLDFDNFLHLTFDKIIFPSSFFMPDSYDYGNFEEIDYNGGIVVDANISKILSNHRLYFRSRASACKWTFSLSEKVCIFHEKTENVFYDDFVDNGLFEDDPLSSFSDSMNTSIVFCRPITIFATLSAFSIINSVYEAQIKYVPSCTEILDDLQMIMMKDVQTMSLTPQPVNVECSSHIIQISILDMRGNSYLWLTTNVESAKLTFSSDERGVDQKHLKLHGLTLATRTILHPSMNPEVEIEFQEAVHHGKINVSVAFDEFEAAQIISVSTTCTSSIILHYSDANEILKFLLTAQSNFAFRKNDTHVTYAVMLLHDILEQSFKYDVSDPVFLTQPSNLWRLRCHHYQNLEDWKQLCQLRQYATKLKLLERPFGDQRNIDLSGLKSLFARKWKLYDDSSTQNSKIFALFTEGKKYLSRTKLSELNWTCPLLTVNYEDCRFNFEGLSFLIRSHPASNKFDFYGKISKTDINLSKSMTTVMGSFAALMDSFGSTETKENASNVCFLLSYVEVSVDLESEILQSQFTNVSICHDIRTSNADDFAGLSQPGPVTQSGSFAASVAKLFFRASDGGTSDFVHAANISLVWSAMLGEYDRTLFLNCSKVSIVLNTVLARYRLLPQPTGSNTIISDRMFNNLLADVCINNVELLAYSKNVQIYFTYTLQQARASVIWNKRSLSADIIIQKQVFSFSKSRIALPKVFCLLRKFVGHANVLVNLGCLVTVLHFDSEKIRDLRTSTEFLSGLPFDSLAKSNRNYALESGTTNISAKVVLQGLQLCHSYLNHIIIAEMRDVQIGLTINPNIQFVGWMPHLVLRALDGGNANEISCEMHLIQILLDGQSQNLLFQLETVQGYASTSILSNFRETNEKYTSQSDNAELSKSLVGTHICCNSTRLELHGDLPSSRPYSITFENNATKVSISRSSFSLLLKETSINACFTADKTTENCIQIPNVSIKSVKLNELTDIVCSVTGLVITINPSLVNHMMSLISPDFADRTSDGDRADSGLSPLAVTFRLKDASLVLHASPDMEKKKDTHRRTPKHVRKIATVPLENEPVSLALPDVTVCFHRAAFAGIIHVQMGECRFEFTPKYMGSVLSFYQQCSFSTNYKNVARKPEEVQNMSFHIRCPRFVIIINCLPYAQVEALIDIEEMIAGSLSQGYYCQLPKLVVVLRHQFAAENCFSFTFLDLIASVGSKTTTDMKCMSITLRLNEFIGTHNARFLQDYLIFKEIWLIDVPTNLDPSLSSFNVLAKSTSLSQSVVHEPNDILLSLRCPKVSFNADLTQSLGRLSLVVENISAKLATTQETVQVFRLNADVLELKSTGRLNGVIFGIVNPRLTALQERGPSENGKVFVRWSISRLLSQLEYNLERIIILDISPLILILKHPSEFGENVSSSPLDVSIEIIRVHGLFSKNSVPYLLQLMEKVVSILEEKQNSAKEKLKSSMEMKYFNQSNSQSSFELGIARQEVVHDSGPVVLVVRLTDMNVTLFKEQFDPSADCAQIKMESLVQTLRKTKLASGAVQRDLLTKLKGQVIIRKCIGKVEKVNQKVEQWSITQWHDHISSRTMKTILNLPPFTMRFDGQELSNKIEHVFQVQFSGPIDVNLNFGFIKFIGDVTKEFNTHYRSSIKDMKSNLLPNSAEDKDKSPKPITTFVATRPVVLDPQLKVIEGAPTDVLKWLGIQKESVPASVHENVVIPMDLLSVKAQYFFGQWFSR